jgi:hypothetical protein
MHKVAQSRHDTCVGIAGLRNDCMIGVTRRLDLAGGALGYFIGVLIELEQSTDFCAIVFRHLMQISTY